MTALLCGCAGDQAGGILNPTTALPSDAPRVLGGQDRSPDRDHAQLVAAFGGEYRAPQAHQLLTEVTGRLVRASERPDEGYQVTILDSPVVNAFALPNGRLYVTRGLIALANDTSELAAVLAHEIAHVTLRHASARLELEARSVLISRVAADVLNDPVAGAMLRDRSRFTLASFSRGQELEADQIGVTTLAKAGFDPYGASRFLNSLGRNVTLRSTALGDTGKASSPDMLSTHPSTPERVSLATQAARRIGAPGIGQDDRARYLSAVDGLAYGDNPADGLVRGRRFFHPRLGVAFEAPEGFALENTSRAVLGGSNDGARRLLFDAVEVKDGQSLADVLRTTWSDAIETGGIETTNINGFPAALATSRGKDWTFRLAAMQVGSNTYRIILAARSASEIDAPFRRMLDSVRQVTAEEVKTLSPLRLQIAAAEPGDTVERFSNRLAVPDRASDRFLVLNGLERGAVLKPGERYKIVVE